MGSLDFVSPDALVVTSVVAKDAAEMFDELLELLASVSPDVVSGLQRFEEEHDVNLRADLAAPLGGEATFAVDGPLLPVPAWKLVVEVYDPASLQRSVEWTLGQANRALEAEGLAPLELTGNESSRGTVWSIHHPEAPFSVHYLMVDGFLIAAPQRALVERALHHRDSGTTLPRSASFAELMPRNGYSDCSALVYRNLVPVADMVGQAGLPGVNQEAMALLAEMSVPGLYCVYGEPRRILLSGTGGSLLGSVPLLGFHGLAGQPLLPTAHAGPPDEVSSGE